MCVTDYQYSSMILLIIYFIGVSLFESERHPPRTTDIHCVVARHVRF